MDLSTTITTTLSLVVIFLFAVQKFSHQVQLIAGERLKGILHKTTNTPLKGVLSGALVTSIMQSSTATSVILVGLVDTGIIATYNAISVVIGANIGTTITAELVALNMTYVAPIIVITGFIISHTHSRFRKYGKSIFYFGIIFLSLFIISHIVAPLKDNSDLQNFLSSISGPYKSIVFGAFITAILQSSSVFTGLTLILVANGFVTLPVAIGFMLGANIGSPLTAIIASTSANFEAKKVAVAHVLFNLFGIIMFIPLLKPFMLLLNVISENAVQQVVNAHFLFNVVSAIVCLIFFNHFHKAVHTATKVLYKN